MPKWPLIIESMFKNCYKNSFKSLDFDIKLE